MSINDSHKDQPEQKNDRKKFVRGFVNFNTERRNNFAKINFNFGFLNLTEEKGLY